MPIFSPLIFSEVISQQAKALILKNKAFAVPEVYGISETSKNKIFAVPEIHGISETFI